MASAFLRRGRVPAGALATLIALAAHTGPAEAKLSGVTRTFTASAGSVSATLTATEFGGGPTATKLHLQIVRAGTIAYSQEVRSASCGQCGVLAGSGGSAPLQVADLEGTGEPNVVLDLYTGGAHCCTVVQVLTYESGAGYEPSERNFFETPARLADLAGNGEVEFVSADNRFAYEFAPYAYSALPLRVLRFAKGGFTTVTRSFPAAIAADASKWLRIFRTERVHGHGNGPIAAWAADEELLGHDRLVKTTLAREARHARLRSSGHYGPSGSSFVRALLRFLHRTGYR